MKLQLTMAFITFSGIFSQLGAQSGAPRNPPATSRAATPQAQAQSTAATQSDVQEFTVAGVRVLLKPATNPVISARLIITGGTANYGAAQAGIEQLALNVLADGGSTKYPKDQYHDLLERTGINISPGSGYDQSTIGLTTLSKNWSQAWDIFKDVLRNPSWDEASFTTLQGQTIAGLQSQQSDPDATVGMLSRKKTFANRRYSIFPEGEPATVEALTLDALKAHYAKIFKTSKLLLVVVGNVDPADLKQKVQATFEGVAPGTPDPFVSSPVEITSSTLTVEPREIATNYALGIFSAPKEGTRDALAMRVGMAILYDRMFSEIRTKRNLSYAPAARVVNGWDPYNVISVSTTKPNEAIGVMIDELGKVRTDGFTSKELRDQKEGFLTRYYLGQETNDAQASALGAFALRGNWRDALTFMDEVYSLNLDEVNATFKRYAKGISWYYLGDKDLIDEKIFLKGF